MADDERYLFDRLAEREEPNPKHQRELNGLKQRERRERARPIWTAEIDAVVNPVTSDQEASTLYLSDGRAVRAARLLGAPEAMSRALHAALDPIEGSALVVFANGATRDFHLLLNTCGSALAVQGWRIHPLAARSELRAVVLVFGRRSWWFCDAEVVLGVRPDGAPGLPDDERRPHDPREWRLARLYQDVDRIQELARQRLGVALHPTLGATGVSAARQCLPEGFIWWKPPSLLREACLRGGAYRGGWQYAVPFVGEAWKVDITRAYTWALSSPLPARVAFGGAYQGDEERPGVFLSRVKGKSILPVPLSLWDADIGEFRKQYVRSVDALAFLPQAENVALRALGYEVRPLLGWSFTQLVSLAPLTDRLAGIAHDYPRGSLFSQFAKGLANSLTGKLGQGPMQDEVCYAAERPEPGWWPFITAEGEVIPYLWARPVKMHRAYQHADSAALITSRVRSKTIMYAHEWERRYGQVVYADTDGLLLTGRSAPTLAYGSDVPGEWRLVGHDEDARVYGKKRYRWQGVEHPIVARDTTAGRLAVARQAGELIVEGRVMGRPWARHPSGAMMGRTSE